MMFDEEIPDEKRRELMKKKLAKLIGETIEQDGMKTMQLVHLKNRITLERGRGCMMSKEERKSLDRLYQEMVDKSETIEWAGVRYAVVRLQVIREIIRLRNGAVIDEKKRGLESRGDKTKKIFKKVIDSIINLSLGDCMILTVDDKRYKVIRIDAREVE